MKIRMQAPEGSVSVCWQGDVIDVEADGSFVCSLEAHDDLIAHGCVLVGQIIDPEAEAEAAAQAAAEAAEAAEAAKKSKK